jgi:arylformamidase
MFSKEIVKQIAAKGINGSIIFPVNPIKMSLNKNYSITGEAPAEHTTAFSVDCAVAEKVLDVTTEKNSNDIVGVRCYTITETTHCSTTHTEGIGHILKHKVTIEEVTKDLEKKLLRAALITVKPTKCTIENITLHPYAKIDDYIITKESIMHALQKIPKKFDKSINVLIVRCDHENFLNKPFHQFKNPPYFSTEAIKYIVEDFEEVENESSKKVKIKHIMTNLPSLDPEKDDGRLLCHVTFFGATKSRNNILEKTENGKLINPLKRTNTEMIYIPKEKEDGMYFVKLIVPANNLDHAASVPLLYDIQESTIQYEEFKKADVEPLNPWSKSF